MRLNMIYIFLNHFTLPPLSIHDEQPYPTPIPSKRPAHTSKSSNKANLRTTHSSKLHPPTCLPRITTVSPQQQCICISDFLEFGNYIGADLGSDDDEDDFDIAPATSAPSAPGPSGGNGSYAPLEGLEDEDEDMEEDNGMEMTLHGVDG